MEPPPQVNDRELEAAFCGAVILEAAARAVGEDTEREHFSRHRLCLVFAATVEVAEALETDGILAVVEELRRREQLRAVGGEDAVRALVSSSSPDYHDLLGVTRRAVRRLRDEGRRVTLRSVREFMKPLEQVSAER